MGFKVQIVEIKENYDNIILTNNLTIEKVKIKYNWLLNASVKNCIIGEDDYGLVWYSGEWICGEWIDGTWYSGIWHDGTWKNGNWYSYLIDKGMLLSNRILILDKSEIYSEFRNGIWENGDFYNGIFGYERDLSTGITYESLTGKNFQSAYWLNGKFFDGIFKNSVWINGIFYKGEMIGSYWLNGKFYSGAFNFHNPGTGNPNWYNGDWYGGDFIEGYWKNGNFYQTDKNIKSRFGLAKTENSITIWLNGNFNSGEFHSGLNEDEKGNPLPSNNNIKTLWKGGNFKGGDWYGGHFQNGIFSNGNWHGGIFNILNGSKNSCKWLDGNWYNGLWINGTFYKGHFYSGIWLNGEFVNGYLSTNLIENPLLKQILATNVAPPSVTATTVTSITTNSVIANGRVTNNGGATILERGICWAKSSVEPLPTTGNSYITDGGSMGNISILISGLIPGNTYNYRVFASNITGLTYSNVIIFETSLSTDTIPIVETKEVTGLGTTYFIANGLLEFSFEPVSEHGFIWATGTTVLESGLTTDIYQGQWASDDVLDPINEPFSALITSITGETIYNYKAYAVNSIGIGYGDVSGFTTPVDSIAVEPTVYTDPTIIVYPTTANVTGKVISDGNSPILAVGACWSLSSNPTLLDSYTVEAATYAPFVTTLTGLTSSTTYHVRAYATNSVGTNYGEDRIFITMAPYSVPTVSITSAVPL
jgi:hypothetical protein